jgi:hypothetical protein
MWETATMILASFMIGFISGAVRERILNEHKNNKK